MNDWNSTVRIDLEVFAKTKSGKSLSYLEGFFAKKRQRGFQLSKVISDAVVSISANAFLLFFALAVTLSSVAKYAIAQSPNPEMPVRLQNTSTLPPDAKIRSNPADGTILYLRSTNLSSILERDQRFRAIQSLGKPAQIALAFIDAYRNLFGIQNPTDEFVLKSVNHDELGYKQVRFRQVFLDIPVWNAEILVQLDQADHVSLVQAHYIRTPSRFNIQPTLDKKQALEIVARTLGIGSECQDCKLETIIYATQKQKSLLAFLVSVTISLIEGWLIVVDANTGLILNKIPTVYSGSEGRRLQ